LRWAIPCTILSKPSIGLEKGEKFPDRQKSIVTGGHEVSPAIKLKGGPLRTVINQRKKNSLQKGLAKAMRILFWIVAIKVSCPAQRGSDGSLSQADY